MADSIATVADPNDFGNEPGEGPLRIGGQGMPAPRDGDKPSTRSPQSARQVPSVRMVRDLWEGTDALRQAGTAYLPKASGEEPDDYRQRLARSAFYNGFRRSVEGLVGLVFRKDPVLSEDVPVQIRGDDNTVGHWENIDNAGTHGDVFVRDLFTDSLAVGHHAILVEFPKTDGQQNALVEMTGEVRPYWVPIKKDDIISWRTEMRGGRTVLSQVVIREASYVPDGMFGTKEQTRYRVLYLGDTGPAWRLLEEQENKSWLEVDFGTYGNQDEIPIAEVTTSGRRSLFDSEPPLKDLAHLNVAHYQMWSDYNWSIHKTCVPFIFGAGIPEAHDEMGNPRPFAVGANSAVITADSAASCQYVSHSGESLGSVKEALDDLKNDMGSLGVAMLAPQKRTAETAEAKRLDKATSDSSLAVAARGLQDGLERALYFHARYLRLDDGGSIQINRDFEGLLMDAPVMQAFGQLVQAGFPPRPVLDALRAGGRIAEDADLDQLEVEWMMGKQLAEAERAAADALVDEKAA